MHVLFQLTQGYTEKGGGEYGEKIAFLVSSLTKIPALYANDQTHCSIGDNKN